jgi:hypothetical protein
MAGKRLVRGHLQRAQEQREIHEGRSHNGISAVINLTARKPEHDAGKHFNGPVEAVRPKVLHENE